MHNMHATLDATLPISFSGDAVCPAISAPPPAGTQNQPPQHGCIQHSAELLPPRLWRRAGLTFERARHVIVAAGYVQCRSDDGLP